MTGSMNKMTKSILYIAVCLEFKSPCSKSLKNIYGNEASDQCHETSFGYFIAGYIHLASIIVNLILLSIAMGTF
jgi:hypothetical protein